MIGTREVDTFSVLGIPLGKFTLSDAIRLVNGWVENPIRVRMITFAAVHMVVTAQYDLELNSILKNMDVVCPDGKPLSWVGRARFGRKVNQVAGPDFMPCFIKQGVERGYKHFIYGGAPGVANLAAANLREMYPGVQIVGTHCPPFRALTSEEGNEVCRIINESGAQLVWVCLGCPKQEKWIAEFQNRLDGKVLLGVGYALDIMAGMGTRAPKAIRHFGFEWAFRLFMDPKRLWKRYLVTNFQFIRLIVLEHLGGFRSSTK